MNIRSLEPHEIPTILELWKSADAEPSVTDTVEDIARILGREYAMFLVAIIEQRIVGSIIVTFDGWRGIIYRLTVHPDFRRQGIALQLTQRAESQLRQWGVRRVIAIVNAKRPVAMNYWASVGYTSDGMTRFYKNL